MKRNKRWEKMKIRIFSVNDGESEMFSLPAWKNENRFSVNVEKAEESFSVSVK
jgi:hypothetical protein